MDVLQTISDDLPWLERLAWLLVIVAVTALVSRVAAKAIRRLTASEDTTLPSGTIFVNIVRVFVWSVGIALALKVSFDINVAGIVAALGVGGIALSLGFQDTLSNLIGGLQISMGKLVQPGDYIEVLGAAGIVTDISWRHTSITDIGGSVHLIPNSVMNKNSIVRLSRHQEVQVPLFVPTETPVETLSDQLVAHVAQQVGTMATLAPRGVYVVWDGTVYGGMTGYVSVNIVRGSANASEVSNVATRSIAADLGFA